MRYRFKALPELYWALFTSGITVLLLTLITFDPEKIGNWQTWAIGLGSGMVRAMAGAALDWVRRQMTHDQESTTDLQNFARNLSPEDKVLLLDALRSSERAPDGS